MKIFFAVVVIVLLFVIGATLYVYKKSAMFLPALLGICGFPKIKESSYYDENGLVRNDPDKCVGCNYCIASCPYDARWSHPITGLPMKCISPGCMEMINEGKQPACVQACPAEARLFGDILDPQSEISKKIASSRTELLMPNKGTKPNFFVVVQK